MNQEERDRLRALAGAATPGPWVAEGYENGATYVFQANDDRSRDPVYYAPTQAIVSVHLRDHQDWDTECNLNARLIAEMRNQIDALLDAADRAERYAAALREIRDQPDFHMRSYDIANVALEGSS